MCRFNRIRDNCFNDLLLNNIFDTACVKLYRMCSQKKYYNLPPISLEELREAV